MTTAYLQSWHSKWAGRAPEARLMEILPLAPGCEVAQRYDKANPPVLDPADYTKNLGLLVPIKYDGDYFMLGWVKAGPTEVVELVGPTMMRYFHPHKKALRELLQKAGGYERHVAADTSGLAWTQTPRGPIPFDVRFVAFLLAQQPGKEFAALMAQVPEAIVHTTLDDARKRIHLSDDAAFPPNPSGGGLINPGGSLRQWSLASSDKVEAMLKALAAPKAPDPLTGVKDHAGAVHHAMRIMESELGLAAIPLMALSEIQRDNPSKVMKIGDGNALGEFCHLLFEEDGARAITEAMIAAMVNTLKISKTLSGMSS